MGERKLHVSRGLAGLDWVLIGGMALIVIGYIFLHDLMGGTFFAHNQWDSYTLQALAWRNGEMALSQNYEHLELAFFNGNYYVSFPPFPSVVLLPFTFFAGENTPNNFIIMVATLLSICMVFWCFRVRGANSFHSMFWAIFFVLGSNMLWMSTMGGVWFMAQALNMTLCTGAVLCMITNKRMLALLLTALAVGCRPFSAIFLVVLFLCMVFYDRNAEGGQGRSGKKDWLACIVQNLKYLIIPVIIIAIYMAYNYARFQDPLEFGHNYLPEFTEETGGYAQFGAQYLPQNLFQLLLRPLEMDASARLVIPRFNGFMFYLANPIFIVWFIILIKDIVNRRMNNIKITIALGFLANLLALACHSTLGGWQWGARYTVDLIPYVLLFFMQPVRTRDKDVRLRRQRNKSAFQPGPLFIFIGIFAVMFNVYGTIYMHFFG